MAADLEPGVVQFSNLGRRQESRFADPAGYNVERRAKAKLLEQGGGAQQVGLTAIVKSNRDRSRREFECLAHRDSAKAAIVDGPHLPFEFRGVEDIANIPRFGFD